MTGTLYTYYLRSSSNTPSSGGDYRLYLSYSATQSVENNSSYITVKAYVERTGLSNTPVSVNQWTEYYGITFDGSRQTLTQGKTTLYNNTTLVWTKQYTVVHDSNGEGSYTLRGDYNIIWGAANFGTEYTSTRTVTLDTIPRASSLTSPVEYFNHTIGNTLYVGVDKKSASFTDNLVFKIGGTTVATRNDFTSGTVTFTSGEINAMYAATPNSNSATMTIELTTKSGTTTTGTDSRTGTAYVTNANPVFTNFTHEDVDSSMLALTGSNQKYISGYSDIKFTITSANKAVAQKGASIVNYIVKCGSKQTTVAYSSSSTVTGTLTNITSSTAEVYAVDTRGNQTLVSKAMTFVAYTNPITASNTTVRTNYINEEVQLTASGTWYSVNFGSQTNSLTATYRYKNTSSSTWITGTSLTITPSSNTWSINQTIVGDVAGGFEPTSSFDIELTVADKIAGYIDTTELQKGTPILHIDANGVGVNKVRENGALDVNGDIYSSGSKVLKETNLKSTTTTSTTDTYNCNYLNTSFAKLGKSLWSGSFTSGSISVPEINNYSLFVFNVGGAFCVGRNYLGGCAFGEYGSYGRTIYTYRVNVSGTTLTIDAINKGGSDGTMNVPITQIIGIF